jgi:hypothetical protein
MRFRLRTLLLVATAIPPIVGVAWNMPAVTLWTNCGGNNAARSYVHEAALMMIMFAEYDPDKPFALASATPQQRQELASLRTSWGVRDGDILVSTKPLCLNQNPPRQILAVCNRPFTNVPQYMFRRAPPTHAVAFSDGSTILMSARDYTALDRTSFIPISQIATSQ